jgi:hypothetical protein
MIFNALPSLSSPLSLPCTVDSFREQHELILTRFTQWMRREPDREHLKAEIRRI